MSTSPFARRTLLTETVLVLAVSLGASAIWSLLRIVAMLSSGVPLSAQTARMNVSAFPDRPWLDLLWQLTGVALGVAPALLALHLLTREDPDARSRIGADLRRPGQDLLRGLLLAAAVGLPGLAWYLGARAAGLSTTIVAADLVPHWWTVPVLVLSAIQSSVLEEVVMVGYLFTRWAQAGWGRWQIIVTSAVIRGCYHLYQGIGGFVGNLVMGLFLGWVYTRTRRVAPLVVAHAVIDIVAFVGYALARDHVGWLT